MPWELSIEPSDGREVLGTVTEIEHQLRAALPAIELFSDASGEEKIAAMEAKGVQVPDFIRETLAGRPSTHQGLLEGREFSIEFSLGAADPVDRIAMDVRGSGNPMDAINAIAAVPGWRVVDLEGRVPSADGWGAFGTWRDKSVDSLKE